MILNIYNDSYIRKKSRFHSKRYSLILYCHFHPKSDVFFIKIFFSVQFFKIQISTSYLIIKIFKWVNYNKMRHPVYKFVFTSFSFIPYYTRSHKKWTVHYNVVVAHFFLTSEYTSILLPSKHSMPISTFNRSNGFRSFLLAKKHVDWLWRFLIYGLCVSFSFSLSFAATRCRITECCATFPML